MHIDGQHTLTLICHLLRACDNEKNNFKACTGRKAHYLSKDVGQQNILLKRTEVAIQPPKPIIVPSHVFFGLIWVNGVLPNN